MESAHLGKKSLEKLIKGKEKYGHKDIWDTFVEEYKDLITINLLKFRKKIDKPGIENFLLHAAWDIVPKEISEAKHYIDNKFSPNGHEIIPASAAFPIIWPERKYQKRLEDLPKELIDSLLGEGHYELFQYINEKYIETNMAGMRDKKDIEYYPPYRLAQVASNLNKKNVPRITIDLILVNNFFRDMADYRGIQQYNIEKLPEYAEIKKLFSKEYANTLFAFLESITNKPKEKYKSSIKRLIADCENFSERDELFKEHFYVPVFVQLSKYLDNTIPLKNLSDAMRIKTSNNNYILLEGTNKLIDNYEITNEALLDLRNDLLRISFKEIVSLMSRHSTYKIDGKTVGEKYQKQEKKLIETYNRFSEMWRKVFPDEEIPLINYDITKEGKKKIN